MSNKTMTGALAIIKRNGTVIGRMRNIRWSEDLRDQEVRGIGSLVVLEAPVVSHSGTFSCDFYEIDFKSTGIPGLINRNVQTIKDFEDNILLRDGIQLDIFKKVEDTVDPVTGFKTAKAQPYAILRNVLLNNEGADITEGAVSGHNMSGRYLDPVIYPE